MKSILICVLLGIFFISCSEKSKEDLSNQENSKSEEVNLEKNFYKRFEGQINNKLDIVLNLLKFDSLLQGSYYYKLKGQTIFLREGNLTGKNKFKIEEYPADRFTGEKTGIFELEFIDNNTLTGKWINPKGDKSFDVKLVEKYNYSAQLKIEETKWFKQDKEIIGEFSHLNPKIIMPENPELEKKINQIFLRQVYTTKYEGREMSAKGELEEFTATYTQMMKDRDWQSSLSSVRDFNVLLNEENILSISFAGYDFMGGAHGTPFVIGFSVDLQTGKIISYNDLFISKYKEQIPKLAYKALLVETGMGEQELDDLLIFTDDPNQKKNIPITDNMLLLKEGLRLEYGAYSIGPYAFGEHFPVIPYSELAGIIKPDSYISKINKIK